MSIILRRGRSHARFSCALVMWWLNERAPVCLEMLSWWRGNRWELAETPPAACFEDIFFCFESYNSFTKEKNNRRALKFTFSLQWTFLTTGGDGEGVGWWKWVHISMILQLFPPPHITFDHAYLCSPNAMLWSWCSFLSYLPVNGNETLHLFVLEWY